MLRTLLLVAAIGLSATPHGAFFRVSSIQTRLGHDWRALGTRVGFVAGGVVHAALSWQAFRLYRGLSAQTGTSTEHQLATEALRWPLGDWLVVLAGLALIFFAVQQVYAAITNRLDLDIEQMRREAGAWAAGLSRFGVAARAVVFALLGWAIVVAGWSRDTSGVGTTTSSLRTIAQQPGALGRWLLGATAAGFVPYGFYEVIHATCTSGASFKFPRNQPRARRIISPVADLAVSVGLCPQLNAIKAKLTS